MHAIVNGRLITAEAVLDGWSLLLEGGRIAALLPQGQLPGGLPQLDAAGLYVAPGLIDVHVHGCGGHDVMDGASRPLQEISRLLATQGVTGFLPTTMTLAWERIEAVLETLRHMAWPGARSLGCHLEGPFLSSARAGAQDARHVRRADFSLLRPHLDVLRLVTMAPEEAGGLLFLSRCREAGLTVSIGHSNASYAEACQAFAAGANHLTHTCNALPPLHHRQPGVLAAALEQGGVFCELIADDLHVHPAMQRLLLREKGPDRLLLVSDAMRASLLPNGTYELGGQPVLVTGPEARLADGTLAGSVLPLWQALQRFRRNTGLPLPQLWRTVSLTPASSIGLGHCKGSIAPGKDADLVFFDEDLSLQATYIGGRCVFQRQDLPTLTPRRI